MLQRSILIFTTLFITLFPITIFTSSNSGQNIANVDLEDYYANFSFDSDDEQPEFVGNHVQEEEEEISTDLEEHYVPPQIIPPIVLEHADNGALQVDDGFAMQQAPQADDVGILQVPQSPVHHPIDVINPNSYNSPSPTYQSIVCPGRPSLPTSSYTFGGVDFLFDSDEAHSLRHSYSVPMLSNAQKKEGFILEIEREEEQLKKDEKIKEALLMFKFYPLYFDFFLRCDLSPSTLEERLVNFFSSSSSLFSCTGSFFSVFTVEDLPVLHNVLPFDYVFSGIYWNRFDGEVLASLLTHYQSNREVFNSFCRNEFKLPGNTLDSDCPPFLKSPAFTDVKRENWLFVGIDQEKIIFKDLFFFFEFYEIIGHQLMEDAPIDISIKRWTCFRIIWLLRFSIFAEKNPISFRLFCQSKYVDENFTSSGDSSSSSSSGPIDTYSSPSGLLRISGASRSFSLCHPYEEDDESKADGNDYSNDEDYYSQLQEYTFNQMPILQRSRSYRPHRLQSTVFNFKKYPIYLALTQKLPENFPEFTIQTEQQFLKNNCQLKFFDMMPVIAALKDNILSEEVYIREILSFFIVPVEQMILYSRESLSVLGSPSCFDTSFNEQVKFYNIWLGRAHLSIVVDNPLLEWFNAKKKNFYTLFRELFPSNGPFNIGGKCYLLLPVYLEHVAKFKGNQYLKEINFLLTTANTSSGKPPSLTLTSLSSSSTTSLPVLFARCTLDYPLAYLKSPHLLVKYQTAIDYGGPQVMWIENLFRFFCDFDGSSSLSSSSSDGGLSSSSYEYTKILEGSLGKRTFLPFLDRSLGKLAGITWGKAYQKGLHAPFKLDPRFWKLIFSISKESCLDYFLKTYRTELMDLWFIRLFEPKPDSTYPLSIFKDAFESSLKEGFLLPKPEGITFNTIEDRSNLFTLIDCSLLEPEEQLKSYYSEKDINWDSRTRIYDEWVERSSDEFYLFIVEFRNAFLEIIPFGAELYCAFEKINLPPTLHAKRQFLYLLEGPDSISMDAILNIFISKLRVCNRNLFWDIPDEPRRTFTLIQVVTSFIKNLSPIQFEKLFIIWAGCSISLFKWNEATPFKVFCLDSTATSIGYRAIDLLNELSPPPPPPINPKKRGLGDDDDSNGMMMTMSNAIEEEEGTQTVIRKTIRHTYYSNDATTLRTTQRGVPFFEPALLQVPPPPTEQDQQISPPSSVDTTDSTDIINGRNFCHIMNAISLELIGREIIEMEPFRMTYDFLGDGIFHLPRFSTCFRDLSVFSDTGVPSLIHALYLSLNQSIDDMIDE